MLPAFQRLTHSAKSQPQLVFHNLMCQLKVGLLSRAFHSLDGHKAKGIDGMTKARYGKELEANLERLQDQLHKGSYHPLPARQVLIPKANGKMRPLAISSLEDKVTQKAVADILTALYEPLFVDASLGFRPKRGCHTALQRLYHWLKEGTRPYVVDVDIEKFFETVDHERMIQILQKRISDQRFLRIIRKLMKAGVMVNGEAVPNTTGTPQGSVVSPILANIYLHDILDQWFSTTYQNQYQKMVRYADDVIFCFKRKEDAEEFYQALEGRLGENGLKLNQEKSRIVSFQQKEHNVFHFLGMTFYWGKDRKRRIFLKLMTQSEKFRGSIRAFTEWIKTNRNRRRTKVLWEEAKAKIRGHYAYYGVSFNRRLASYYMLCGKILYKWLNRRSQKTSMSWDRFLKRLKRDPLPKPWGCDCLDITQGVFEYAI